LSILNPARVRHFAKAMGKAKTDPLDTQVIAKFARTTEPKPTPAPEPLMRELCELLQRRDSLIESRAGEQTPRGQTRHKMLLKQAEDLIERLGQQISQIDRLMAKLVEGSAELKAKIQHLCEVKGVGVLTALTLLVTVPELGKLGRNRISRLVGLAPLNDDSGTPSKANASFRADANVHAVCPLHGNLKCHSTQPCSSCLLPTIAQSR
jgi:transposase